MRFISITCTLLGLLCTTQFSIKAQDLQNDLTVQDSLFWQAYNSCDVEGMSTFLAEDLEFYHDKGGLTSSLAIFKKQLQEGLCSDPESRLERVAKDGTVKVFPLNNYGGIITGDHIFMRHRKGEDPYAEEEAKFTHIWQFQQGAWKMTRVISYDHQPVPFEQAKVAISLSNTELDELTGKYEGSQTGKVEIVRAEQSLQLVAAQFAFKLYAQNANTFFIKERNLTFAFIKDESGKTVKLEVIENGKLAETLFKKN